MGHSFHRTTGNDNWRANKKVCWMEGVDDNKRAAWYARVEQIYRAQTARSAGQSFDDSQYKHHPLEERTRSPVVVNPPIKYVRM